VSLWHPMQQTSMGFGSWLRYCTDIAQRRSIKLCAMFGRLLGWYAIYTISGALAPNGILPGAKFTLRPSLSFSYTGSVTARHLSSGRQPNFAAFSRERQLYSTGRPSRWASAHILVKSFIHSHTWQYNTVNAKKPVTRNVGQCPT